MNCPLTARGQLLDGKLVPKVGGKCGMHKTPSSRRLPANRLRSMARASPALKEKLIDAIVNNQDPGFGAGLPPAAVAILEQMEAEVKNSKPHLKEEELLGDFDGVASRIVSIDSMGIVTLGQFSFMQFKPNDMKVKLLGGKTVTNRSTDQEPYAIISRFEVADGEFAGLEGTQKAIAKWDIDEQDPARMNVTFVGSKIMPTNPQDLDRWKAAFQDHNALDQDGVWIMNFDKGRTGYRDFVYVDKDFQVSKGNRGSWTVLERKQNLN